MLEWTPSTIALIVAGVIVLMLIVVLTARRSRKNRDEREFENQSRAEELRQEADRDRVALCEEEVQVHEQELAVERARV